MAQKYIVRCKDTTQTSGTGTLTLDNASAANWQTPSQAVTRTLLTNGDTVRYTISDTSNPVLFEEGIGTIGSAGLTLTRDTVRQSSSGTSKISWPSGGARDVVIAWSPGDTALISNQGSDYTAATFATNLGLPRLAASNTYTENQLIQKSSAGVLDLLDMRNTATASTANRAAMVLRAPTTALPNASFRLAAGFSNIGSGTEEANVEFRGYSAGAFGTLFSYNQGLKNASGNKYDAFPSGFVMLAESVPTGWTRSDVTGGRLIKLATSADTLGAESGSDDPFDGSWGTQGAVLTVANLPTTESSFAVRTSGSGGSTAGLVYQVDGSAPLVGAGFTQSQGSGTAHAHSITLPNYRVMGRIVKS